MPMGLADVTDPTDNRQSYYKVLPKGYGIRTISQTGGALEINTHCSVVERHSMTAQLCISMLRYHTVAQ